MRAVILAAQANASHPLVNQPSKIIDRHGALRMTRDWLTISVDALKQTDLEVAEGALKAGGPLLLQHRFQCLPQFAQATLTEPLCLDEHGALFGPGMMV